MALTQKNFADLIIFNRSGAAARFNAMKKLEFVAANAPRFDYDPATGQLRGLLIEDQRTNLFLWSSDLSKSSWIKGALGLQAGQASIKGDNSACLLTPFTDNSQPQLTQTVAVSGTAYTVSFVVSSAGAGAAYIQMQGGTSINAACRATLNLTTGSLTAIEYFGTAFSGAAATATALGNNRWRLSLSAVVNLPGEGLRGVLGPSRSSTGAVPVNMTDALLVELPQFEAGSLCTSIIQTDGAQVTRAADIATVIDLGPWFSSLEGTLYVEAIPCAADATSKGLASLFVSGSAENRLTLFRQGGSAAALLWYNKPGTPDRGGKTAAPGGLVVKSAVAFNNAGGRSISVNGATAASTTVTDGPALSLMNTLAIMRAYGTTNEIMSGHIRTLRYWPRRLSDAELQALTA